MSRCFPYPPPGYALTSARKETLIESIKFKKEKVKADELRKKEKKREKKEKRKAKKDKKIHNKDNSDIVHGHIGDKLWTAAKVDFSPKVIKAESEQLERSSLTEEHAKPVCLRVPSSSSDSTENSNKRKRPPFPVDVSRGHGKTIRIRLSSKKQNQSDASVDEQKHCSTSGNEQKHCSTSASIQFPPQTGNNTAVRSQDFCSTSVPTSNVGRSLVLKTGGERIHVASKQIQTAPAIRTTALPAAAADVVMTPLQKEGLLYKNLIESLVPPQLQDVDTADDDWLFGGKNKVERSEKRLMCRDDSMSFCNTSLLFPRAQYLPEVDIYALPYTIPF